MPNQHLAGHPMIFHSPPQPRRDLLLARRSAENTVLRMAETGSKIFLMSWGPTAASHSGQQRSCATVRVMSRPRQGKRQPAGSPGQVGTRSNEGGADNVPCWTRHTAATCDGTGALAPDSKAERRHWQDQLSDTQPPCHPGTCSPRTWALAPVVHGHALARGGAEGQAALAGGAGQRSLGAWGATEEAVAQRVLLALAVLSPAQGSIEAASKFEEVWVLKEYGAVQMAKS